MVEVRTTIQAFRKMAIVAGNPIFESKGAVVTSAYGLTLLAKKDDPARMFPTSLPLRSLGYSGITSYDYQGITKEHLLEELIERIEEFTIDELETLRVLIEKKRA